MRKDKLQNFTRELRKRRTRAKLYGTEKRPRLSIFRSNQYTYAQLINDAAGKTLASVSTQAAAKGTKSEQAKKVGEKLAEAAKKLGIKEAIFDRGHYKYHGRVKAIAEGAREGGLQI